MIPVKGATLPTSGILSYLYPRTPEHTHQGIDLPARHGTPVHAATSGMVTWAINQYTPGFSGYGKTVVIKGNDNKFYLYSHLNEIRTGLGAYVHTGQIIGTVGRTKYSRTDPTGDIRGGPHLHFEVSSTPYPKHSESPRLDPVRTLSNLDKKSNWLAGIVGMGIGGVIYWLKGGK